MNRLITYYIIVLSVFNTICFSQSNTVPDVVTKVATCAANWLKLETGTRAIGMGGAYTAVGNGISGVPYNPASIAFIDNQEAFLSQTKYVADITYSVLGFGRNMSGTDFVGIHIFGIHTFTHSYVHNEIINIEHFHILCTFSHIFHINVTQIHINDGLNDTNTTHNGPRVTHSNTQINQNKVSHGTDSHMTSPTPETPLTSHFGDSIQSNTTDINNSHRTIITDEFEGSGGSPTAKQLDRFHTEEVE